MTMRPRLVPELHCSDLDKSLAFYVGLLGFRILYDRPEDRFAYLDRCGAELMLEEYAPGARMLAKAPFEQPYGRGINFQIQVENADALHAAVIAAGLPIFLPMEERVPPRQHRDRDASVHRPGSGRIPAPPPSRPGHPPDYRLSRPVLDAF